MRKSDDLGYGVVGVGRSHVEVGAGLAASGFDVAALDRTGEREVEFGATRRRGDGDLANVRVPRKLGQQSKPDGQCRVPEGRWPFVVASDGRWFVGEHDVGAVGSPLEWVLRREKLGRRGDCVVDRARLQVTAREQAVDPFPRDRCRVVVGGAHGSSGCAVEVGCGVATVGATSMGSVNRMVRGSTHASSVQA